MTESVLRYIEAAGIALLAVFAPIQTTLIVVGVLVFADLVLGISVALKKRHKITSNKLRKTVVKLGVYQVCLASCYLGEHYVGLPVPATKILAGLIVASELKSLLEHCETLTGISIFRVLLAKLNTSGGIKNKEDSS